MSCRLLVHVEMATVAGGFCEKLLIVDTGAAVSAIPAEWVDDLELPEDERLLVQGKHRWGFAPHRWAGEHSDIENGRREERLEEVAAVGCRFITREHGRTPGFLLPVYLIQDRRDLPRPVLGLLGLVIPHTMRFQYRRTKRRVYDAGVSSMEVESQPCSYTYSGWRMRRGALKIHFADEASQ